jgi:pantothenate kinase
MLAPKIFLDSNLALARERVIARHVRGGCTVEQATAKYESNDRINAEIVLSTRVNADIHICEEE